MSTATQHIETRQTGHFWKLRVKKVELGDPDRYGQKRVTGELEQEVGGNTETEPGMWTQLNAAKEKLGVS